MRRPIPDAARTFAPEREREHRSSPRRALDAHRAIHRLREAPADHEAQPRPPEFPRDRGVRLRERLEQGADALWGYSNPRVPHRTLDLDEASLLARGRLPARRDAHEDLAGVGEFHGVAQQVHEDLPHPRPVAEHPGGHAGRERRREGEPLLLGRGGEEIERVLDALPQAERGDLQLQPARLDLGEIEDVIDHREERVAARADGPRQIPLVRGELVVEQEPRHADHAVERRPDLVAHRREELALRAGGLDGRVARRHELLPLRLVAQQELADRGLPLLDHGDVLPVHARRRVHERQHHPEEEDEVHEHERPCHRHRGHPGGEAAHHFETARGQDAEHRPRRGGPDPEEITRRDGDAGEEPDHGRHRLPARERAAHDAEDRRARQRVREGAGEVRPPREHEIEHRRDDGADRVHRHDEAAHQDQTGEDVKNPPDDAQPQERSQLTGEPHIIGRRTRGAHKRPLVAG